MWTRAEARSDTLPQIRRKLETEYLHLIRKLQEGGRARKVFDLQNVNTLLVVDVLEKQGIR